MEAANEEQLREAACFADVDAVKTLIAKGIDVNSVHSINGWSPLHWASKRGHVAIVEHLLLAGADKTLKSTKGETPVDLAESGDVRKLLGEETDSENSGDRLANNLPITPNYLRNPVLGYTVQMDDKSSDSEKHTSEGKRSSSSTYNVRVIKARVANLEDEDFIEVEIPTTDMTFKNLIQICCQELLIDLRQITRVRKLPNTKLRNDKDVKRLNDFQEVEFVVLSHPNRRRPRTGDNGVSNQAAFSQSVLAEKSAYCRNGTILY